MKTIDWQKTLNNIIFHHTTTTVEFDVKDIESLAKYIETTNRERLELQNRIDKLEKENYKLSTSLMTNLLDSAPSDNISTFKIYA